MAYQHYGFKLNKNIRDINFSELKRVSKKNKAEIPLLKDLLKASKNKYSLLLEIKPIFSKNILLNLIKLTKKIKKCGIISFKEKNIIDLYKLNKVKDIYSVDTGSSVSLGFDFKISNLDENKEVKNEKFRFGKKFC